MAVPTGGFVMRNSLFTVEGTDYANQCKKIRLVPEGETQTYRTLVPDGVIVDEDSSVWTLEVTGLQINITGGLAKLLRDSTEGDELDCVFAPKNVSGEQKATFTALAKKVPLGEEQGKFAEFDFALAVKGAPVFSAVA